MSLIDPRPADGVNDALHRATAALVEDATLSGEISGNTCNLRNDRRTIRWQRKQHSFSSRPFLLFRPGPTTGQW
jgi:hypothetical protein